VAYTFVSPEEGPQLTRIEVRIDKLLTRDEIPGFIAFETKDASPPKPSAEGGSPEQPKPKPAPALLGKGRGPKRHRRAL